MFISSVFITVFVLVMQILLLHFDELVGKNISWSMYAQLVGYIGMHITPQAFPLGILIASVMTFGNLSERAELIAMKSAGISLFRILLPLGIFVVLWSGFAFYSNSYIVPKASLNLITLLYDLRKKKPDWVIKEGVFYDGIPGYSIRVTKRLPDKKALQGVLIYDHTQEKGNVSVTMAKTGTIDTIQDERYLAIDLFNGHNYIEFSSKEKQGKQPGSAIPLFYRSNFKTQRLLFDLDSFKLRRTQKEIFSSLDRSKNTQQLTTEIRELMQQLAAEHKACQNTLSSYFMKLYDHETQEALTAGHMPMHSIQDIQHLRAPEVDHDSVVNGLSARAIAQQQTIVQYAIAQAKGCKERLQNHHSARRSIEKKLRSLQVEQHKMMSWAVSCLIIFLCGASLGATIRRGRIEIQALLATISVILYYSMELTGVRWARIGVLSPWLGTWAANIMLLPLGLFLLSKAQKDARLFTKVDLSAFWAWAKHRTTSK